METVFVEQLSAAIAPGANVAGTVIFQRPPTVSRPSGGLPSLWIFREARNGYCRSITPMATRQALRWWNPSTLKQDISVFLTFYDTSGATLLTDSFTLAHTQHSAITLTQKYPQVIGRFGTLPRSRLSGPVVNVLGFHVSPTGVIHTSTSRRRPGRTAPC